MIVLFAAGHVAGPKIWMGYNEDESMLDLARRKARYAADTYGQDTRVFDVTTGGSYNLVEAACRDCDIASFEHSNADDSIDELNEPNRVVIYRTVQNPGDGPCRAIGLETARILNTYLSPIQHRASTTGGDWYGVLKRAMQAGCSDAYLIEHGFHTHGQTRALLSDPDVRQQLAVAEVDAMAVYYGWTKTEDDMLKAGDKSDAVKIWQTALIEAGFSLDPYGADGSFGPLTARQTDAFKSAAGLAIYSPVTVYLDEWLAMARYMAGKADTAALQVAQEQAKQLETMLESKAAALLTVTQRYNGLAKAAQIIRDAVPM